MPQPIASPERIPPPEAAFCSIFLGQRARLQQCRIQQTRRLQTSFLNQLAWSSDPQANSQILLWLGLFPVNLRIIPEPQLLRRQINTISTNLNGSYKQLLQAMILDPALQLSLNGTSNKRNKPNENLARELLELFSLGEGNYTEADVIEAARALTGYRLDQDKRIVLEPEQHDPLEKTILGRRFAFDAPSLVAWLCEQPATARNITARVWRRLIGPQPSRATLGALASGWHRQKLSIPWLIQAITKTEEARAHKGERLIDPIEMVVKSLRLIGSRHPDAIDISLQGLRAMGQPFLEPPSVKGWPENEQWLQFRWLEARRSTLQRLLSNEEVWESARPPSLLELTLTPIQPLNLTLPAPASPTNISRLFADPVWQLA
ncbi:MAG: DUF1800 family protein [Cyanobacteriota bacterium]